MRTSRPLVFAWTVALALAVAACSEKPAPQTEASNPVAPTAPTGAESTPTAAAPAAPTPAAQEPDETLTIDLAKVQKPWSGDLDGMIERRSIRVLTVNSKTTYFIDKGVLRGTAVEFGRLFEDELNKKLAA